MMHKIPFTKMHGCGNDYIYVNAMQHPIGNPQACAVAWSDRYKGIGSDGLVLIDRSPVPERLRVGASAGMRLRVGEQGPGMADFSMRIFNADGSEAMMCGNASRCIGKYLYERGLTDKTEIRLLTQSGMKTLLLHVAGGRVDCVTVDMGEPVLEDESQFVDTRGLSRGTFVSMGNPHYVIFTDDIDQVGEAGRILEHHPAFPQRCNIEFARVDAGATIRTRVWERGSGITQACGTGACATAVAACLSGRAGRESDIVMDGGTLHIEWRESDRSAALDQRSLATEGTQEGRFFQKNHVYMTGPAEFVFDGEIEIVDDQTTRQPNNLKKWH